MNAGGGSVFDLSPAEKLQLVEDLWDDLAATPEAVPVHNWQKEELARRKANLMSDPASGLSWRRLSEGFAVGMAADLTIVPEAQQDLDEAYAW
jgi:putative addiction module component (TIGR02574 family)